MKQICKIFIIGHFAQLFILFFHKIGERVFRPWYVRVFSLFWFKSDYYCFKEWGCKDNFTIEFELLAMSLNKNMIHFSQFVVISFWDV